MNAKKFYLLIVIALVMGLIPQRNVSADMGPKPTMEFEFKLEGIGFDEIKSIKLMECDYSKVCEDGHLFEENFPPEAQQYFGSCELSGCAFSYYDFDVYHQLVIQLSNGTTLKSNVFRNSYFDSRFKVLIQRDSLVVDELKGADFRERMMGIVIVSFLASSVLVGVLVICVIVLTVRALAIKDTRSSFLKNLGKVLFWTALVICVLLGLGMSAYTFIATMGIEICGAYLYLRYKKLPAKKILYGFLIANAFTQPLFVFSSYYFVINSWTTVLALEAIIWLVETGIVNKVQEKQLYLKHILVLTLILNAASFGIGLLLPI